MRVSSIVRQNDIIHLFRETININATCIRNILRLFALLRVFYIFANQRFHVKIIFRTHYCLSTECIPVIKNNF